MTLSIHLPPGYLPRTVTLAARKVGRTWRVGGVDANGTFFPYYSAAPFPRLRDALAWLEALDIRPGVTSTYARAIDATQVDNSKWVA